MAKIKETNDENTISTVIKSILKDKNSDIINSWLCNVIETEIKENTTYLTTLKLTKLTNDMFINYNICKNEIETKLICDKLLSQLIKYNLIPKYIELYPINSICLALYNYDNKYYKAKIINIIEPGIKYEIKYIDYDDDSIIVNINTLKYQKNNDIKNIKLKDNIIEQKNDKNIQSILNENTDQIIGIKSKKYTNSLIKVDEIKNNINDNNDELINKFEEYDNDNDNNDDEESEYKIDGTCVMCKRKIPTTFHHLVPKSTHNKYIKEYGGDKLKWSKYGIWICRACHTAIHGIYDNWILATEYNSLEKLMDSDKVLKWVNYIEKKRNTKHSYDNRVKKANRIAQLQTNKKMKDKSVEIKFV